MESAMKPTDAFSASDRIEFRRVEIKYEWDTGRQFSAVEVVINGVGLSRRWQEATTRSVSPMLIAELGEELAPWGSYPPQPMPEAEEVPDGFAPVLNCSCGTFGCGGTCTHASSSSPIPWRGMTSTRLLAIG